MLTKEQLLAGAKAIDAYTDEIGDKMKLRQPDVARSPAFAGAMMICAALMVAMTAMAESAPEQEDRT